MHVLLCMCSYIYTIFMTNNFTTYSRLIQLSVKLQLLAMYIATYVVVVYAAQKQY